MPASRPKPPWPGGTEVVHIEDLEGLLLLRATIHGADGRDTTGPLALDTGAGFLALDGELARVIGLTDSATKSEEIQVAPRALARLEIGRLQLDQVSPVLTIDADVVRRVSDRPVLGLLGQKPLANRALWLDYAGETLALIPSGSRTEPGGTLTAPSARAAEALHVANSRAALTGLLALTARPVPFELAGDGKILVHARVSNPVPPRFSPDLTWIVDTGATKCVLFEDSLAGLAPGSARWPALRGLSAPTLIGTSEARMAMIPEVELVSGVDTVRIPHVDVALMQSDLASALSRVVGTRVHGLIGASILRRFRVVIDYPNEVLWLQLSSGTRGVRPFEYCHVGIQIERREGMARVVAVAYGTPAARAGIQVGDELIALRGEPVAGRDLTTLTRALEGPPGTRISLTLRRGGVEHTYVLVRRRLL